MPIRSKVSAEDLKNNSNADYNAFVAICFTADGRGNFSLLSPIQKVGRLISLYNAEVDNGGHLQYFSNNGTIEAQETIDALKSEGAFCQAEILEKATELWNFKERKPFESVQQYVDKSLGDEFGTYDKLFYDCKPNLYHFIHKHFDKNKDEYIKFVD